MRGLVHNVQDENQWTEEKRCDEHNLPVCTDKQCLERHKWLLKKKFDGHGFIAYKQCKSEKVVEVSRHCDFHPSQCAAVESVKLKETIRVKGKITIREKCFVVLFTD